MKKKTKISLDTVHGKLIQIDNGSAFNHLSYIVQDINGITTLKTADFNIAVKQLYSQPKTRYGKKITIYDNEGETFDRITILFNNLRTKKGFRQYEYDCISASESGSGMFIWGTAMKGKHLGKKVNFEELNEELQKRIIRVTDSMAHY